MGLESLDEYTGIVSKHAAWLGGFFEIGGTVGFDISRELYAVPLLKFSDNDHRKVGDFKSVFGGSIVPKRNSLELSVKSARAMKMILAMESYAPSRAPVVSLLKRWSDLSDSEKWDKVSRLRGYRRQLVALLSPSDYNDLVNDPRFVAGVLGNRRTFSSEFIEQGSGQRPLKISSTNVSLLRALSRRHSSGNLRIDEGRRIKRGQFFKYQPEQVPAAISIEFGLRETRDLLEFTQGHHLLPIPGQIIQELVTT